MTRRRSFAIASLFVAATGCKFDPNSTGAPLATPVAIRGVRVNVATPDDGKNVHGEVQRGTGQQVAEALREVLAEHGAIDGGRAGGVIVTPTIAEWTDRASTGGFNRGDTVKVRLRVSYADGRLVDDRTIAARADPDTFKQQTPFHLLRPLFREWADGIFGKATR